MIVYENPKSLLRDLTRKAKGTEWYRKILGYYSTEFNPRGYCVESVYEKGSVQIYPEVALEKWTP